MDLFRRMLRYLPLALLLLVIGCGLALFVSGVFVSGVAGSLQAQPPSASPSADAVQVRVEALEKRVQTMDRLVSFLMTFVSVYAIALSLGSYFGLSQILRGAENDRKDIGALKDDARGKLTDLAAEIKRLIDRTERELDQEKTEVRRVREELHNAVPFLTEVGHTLAQVVQRLERDLDFESIRWREPESYSSISPRGRHEIQQAELTMAGLTSFDLGRLPQFGGRLARIHGKLGQFYAARYHAPAAQSGRLVDDLLRAHHYFDQSVRFDGRAAQAFRDRVVVRWVMAAVPGLWQPRQQFLDEAEADFKECLRLDPSNLGALFNLAYFDHIGGRYPAAVERLEKLIRLSADASAEERKKFLSSAYLNLACALAARQPQAVGGEPALRATLLGHLQTGATAAQQLGNPNEFVRELRRECEDPAGPLRKLYELEKDRLDALLASAV